MQRKNAYRLTEVLGLGPTAAFGRGAHEGSSRRVFVRFQEHDGSVRWTEGMRSAEEEAEFGQNLPIGVGMKILFAGRVGADEVVVWADKGERCLAELCREKKPNIMEFLHTAIALCEAVESLHSHDIVHRCLNPLTIFVDEQANAVRLADWRFAGYQYESCPEHVLQHSLNSSSLAPEQWEGARSPADVRTDIFATGVVLFRWLSGKNPFRGISPEAVSRQMLVGQPDIVALKNAHVPSPVIEILERTLARRPGHRYQSMRGLKHDLQRCQTELASTGTIETFSLGANDVPGQLSLTHGFVGRRRELEILEEHYLMACENGVAAVFIGGEAGIGKTELCRQFSRLERQALVCVGKCEPSRGSKPYQVIDEALSMLVMSLLGLPQDQHDELRLLLLEQLGRSANSLVRIFPVLRGVINRREDDEAHEPKPAWPSPEIVSDYLVEFFSTITGNIAPIILNFDDMQWIDHQSQRVLMGMLRNERMTKVFIMGSHRTEAGAPPEWIAEELEREEQLVCPVFLLEVGGLSGDEVGELIIQRTGSEVENLADLQDLACFRSKGNPFFVHQLLVDLQTGNQLEQSSEFGGWVFHPSEAQTSLGAMSVQDIVQDRIERLSEQARRVLVLAQCFGTALEVGELSRCAGLQHNEFSKILTEVIQWGLLQVERNQVRFTHDRVIDAVRSFATKQEIVEYQLRIAFFIEQEATNNPAVARNSGEYIREAMSGLDHETRLHQREKNIRASEASLLARDYNAALAHAKMALEIDEGIPSQEKSTDALALFENLAAAYAANGKYQDARRAVDRAYQFAESETEAIRIFEMMKDIYLAEGSRTNDLKGVGFELLSRLGVDIVDDIDSISQMIVIDTNEIQMRVASRQPRDLIHLPEMTDEEQRNQLQVLGVLWEIVQYDGDKPLAAFIVTRMVRMSLEHGNGKYSAFGFVLFGALIASRGRYEEGFEYGRMALELGARSGGGRNRSKVAAIYSNLLGYLRNPAHDSVVLYDQCAMLSDDVGDYVNGSWCAVFSVWMRLLSGAPLPEVVDRIGAISDYVEKVKIGWAVELLDRVKESVYTMSGEFSESSIKTVQEEEEHQRSELEKLLPGKTWEAIIAGQRALIMDETDDALALLEARSIILDPEIVTIPIIQIFFLRMMLRLSESRKRYRSVTNSEFDSKNETDRERIFRWSRTCRTNFRYQELTYLAVEAKDIGDKWEATQLFSDAIDEAHAAKIQWVAGVIAQEAAHYAHGHGHFALATTFLHRAINAFISLGAAPAVARLRNHFYSLLSGQTGTYAAVQIPKVIPGNFDESSFGDTTIEIGSFFDSMRAMSGMVSEEELLKNATRAIIGVSGATTAIICVQENHSIDVRSRTSKRFGNEIIIETVPIDDFTEGPVRLLRSVAREQSVIISGEASNDPSLVWEPYFRDYAIRSVLCLPVVVDEESVGVLYLEDNLQSDAYRNIHVTTIEVLFSQMLTNLFNVSLHGELRSALEERESARDELALGRERMIRSQRLGQMGIWEWDTVHDIVYLSETASRMFGYEHEEMEISLPMFLDQVHPDDRTYVRVAFERSYAGDGVRVEHRVEDDDEPTRWLYVKGNVERDGEDRIVRVAGVVHDITEQKRAEEEQQSMFAQLQQSQRMEAIGQLTGGIAHDFNNILTVILSYAHMARGALNPNHRIHEYLEEIALAGNRGGELVRKLVSYSRQDYGPVKAIQIEHPIRETMKLLASTLPIGIRVVTDLEEQLPGVLCDSVQINQVLLNCCLNARDAMGEFGQLHVKLMARPAEGTCSSCDAQFLGRYVVLSVSDTGTGIPEDDIPRVFKAFFSTKTEHQGTGLGLSMVHRLVHQAGGHCMVESVVGEGTTINLLFPPEDMASSGASLVSVPKFSKYYQLPVEDIGRILLIDDQQQVLRLFASILGEHGLDVEAFLDPIDALEAFQADPKAYDCIVTDFSMPQMTGIELLRKVFEIRTDIAAILCTGNLAASADWEIGDTEGIRVLHKPIGADDLVAAVGAALEEFRENTAPRTVH